MEPSEIQSSCLAAAVSRNGSFSIAVERLQFFVLFASLIGAASFAQAEENTAPAEQAVSRQGEVPKRVVGATALVAEAESDLNFVARVDTGASTCSVHVEKWVIQGEASEMKANIGKTIRFLVKNNDRAAHWLERKIAAVAVIKTSEESEARYKVPMTLECEGVSKRVLVSLNDRAHMKHPLLVGRNFLDGDFLVDVSK